jgi:hypothetical protein
MLHAKGRKQKFKRKKKGFELIDKRIKREKELMFFKRGNKGFAAAIAVAPTERRNRCLIALQMLVTQIKREKKGFCKWWCEAR